MKTQHQTPPISPLEARTSQGMLLKYVAEQVGVDPSTLHRWERGHTRPDAGKLLKLAAVLRLEGESFHRLARWFEEQS